MPHACTLSGMLRPPATLQWLTLFWAVLRTPVFAVLCWTVMAPHALRAALDAAATRRLPPHGRLAALGAGLACTGEAQGAAHLLPI